MAETALALIPARAGSKRLPNKNLLPVAGRPLIAWTIAAALDSGCFERVVVSTDSAELAEVALAAGAEVPFMRPEALASDTASSMDVIFHALDQLAAAGDLPALTALLQPTSPLRNADDIRAAFARLQGSGGDSVVSVSEVEHSPLWSNTLPADGSLAAFLRPEVLGKRSQDLPQYYRLNGAIYLARTRVLQARGSFFGPGSFACVMPAERAIDIDHRTDLLLADLLLREACGA
ncbi:acylneuraminate cytidylyltransferase family protein [Chitinibacteraceae bacterium HSL-7]